MDTELITILILGLVGGAVAGLLGIGGGTVLVPALVIFLHYSQKEAQGTSLAVLLFPVVVLGVLNYHEQGLVHWRTSLILGVTFVLGAFLGSKFAVWLPEQLNFGAFTIEKPMKKIFAVFLLFMAIKTFMK